MTKHCPTCKTDKPTSEFHSNAGRKDGLASNCKICKQLHQKKWYGGHTEEQKKRIRVRKLDLKTRNKQNVDEYLKVHPCVDCGEKDIVVLDFDHVRGQKKNEIARMKFDCSWEAIKQEIDKCEVRCANCHRRVTHKRRNNF